MFTILYSFFTLVSLSLALRPLLTFFRDEKGFRKYPCQNWLSGITAKAYGWEVGRKHDVFHTKRLHDAHVKDAIIRVGPNWLSFGSSRAVKDIYGYNSLCNKGAIYAALQGGGKNVLTMVNRSEHSDRRRIIAVAYAPRKIEVWESKVVESVARVLKQMDKMCTGPMTPKHSIPKKEDFKFDGVQWSYLFAVEATVKLGLSKDLHFTEAGNDLFPVTDATRRVRSISFRQSFRGGVRATSTVVWDTEWFPFLKKATRALSAKYRENWQHGEDSGAILTTLTKERIQRFKDGEILDDLFQPMIQGKSGGTPDIDDQDRIAETDQMSMSSSPRDFDVRAPNIFTSQRRRRFCCHLSCLHSLLPCQKPRNSGQAARGARLRPLPYHRRRRSLVNGPKSPLPPSLRRRVHAPFSSSCHRSRSPYPSRRYQYRWSHDPRRHGGVYLGIYGASRSERVP